MGTRREETEGGPPCYALLCSHAEVRLAAVLVMVNLITHGLRHRIKRKKRGGRGRGEGGGGGRLTL